MSDPESTRASFRALHATGCFAIPNPWDPGSAKALEQLGFAALATTSAGFAFSRGLPDAPDALPLGAVLAHVAEIVGATTLPVNADLQAGYARTAEGVAENVARCAATGVAGLSIEDLGENGALYTQDEATERIAAARSALDRAAGDVLLTARAECFLTGHADPLGESIRRLQAYSDAGADVLFAPGVSEPQQIRALAEAVAPKPLNVLMSSNTGLTLADLAELGVRRVSVGSALARTAWGAFLRAAEEIAGLGSFAELRGAAPFDRLNAMLGDATQSRQ